MSTEDEFRSWLNRKEKSFLENLQFALKAWQSLEFTLITKYETILTWISNEVLKHIGEFPFEEIKELLHYRAPSGLVKTDTKCLFVNAVLKALPNDLIKTREVSELLSFLLEFELLQDVYRFDNKLYGKVFAMLLSLYEKYMEQVDVEKSLNKEIEFITNVINAFKDKAKNTSNTKQFANAYNETVVQAFIELLLTLRSYKIDIFPELLLIEQILYQESTEKELLERAKNGPIHVQLILIECCILNRRNVELFQRELLKVFFMKQTLMNNPDKISESLKVATHILEVFQKNDITFFVDGKESMKLLGNKIKMWVDKQKTKYFVEILMLLCATLRYNPLILEQHIFQITCWLIVADKNEYNGEQHLFEEYMKTLLEVFRKLSRAEKLVANLLKSIKEWLQHNRIAICVNKRKRKSTFSISNTPPAKTSKTVENINVGNTDILKSVKGFENKYVDQIFENIYSPGINRSFAPQVISHTRKSFEFLHNTWPTVSVGIKFSNIITGLVSKPSITIWKSLLYSLKDQLAKIENNNEDLDENTLFLLDLHCAMLCQYFSGCKLIEQADKFLEQIDEERLHTKQVLTTFAKIVLSKEHNNRLTAAFLELLYHVNLFNLLLFYYIPDGLKLNGRKLNENIYSLLTKEEWSVIEQNVLHFGKSNTQFLLNRLNLQAKQSELLSSKILKEFQLHKDFLKFGKEVTQLENLIEDESSKWFISYINKQDKIKIANLMKRKVHLYPAIEEDSDCVEYLTIEIVENLYKNFSLLNGSSITALNINFTTIRDDINSPDFDTLIKHYATRLCSHEISFIENILNKEEINWWFEALEKLPVAYIRQEKKWIICILLMAIYQDLCYLEDEDLSGKTYSILIDLLRFGPHLAIFQIFDCENILKILPIKKCWSFYEFLFSKFKTGEKGTDEFLKSSSEVLKTLKDNFNNEYCQLLVFTIDALSNINGPVAKHLKPQLNEFLDIYGNYIHNQFNCFKTMENNSKKQKKFVEKTLPGFPYYVNSVLIKHKQESTGQEEFKTEINEDFIHLIKFYIGYSLDYKNVHAIRLMNVALKHRKQLKMDQAEIEVMLSAYWRQLNSDLKSSTKIDAKSSENVIKLIIDHKTNEDFVLTLKNLWDLVEKNTIMDGYENVLNMLTLIAKCSLSTIKGAIFNENFKQITINISMRLSRNEKQQFVNLDQVHSLLKCQQALIENRMIPLSLDTLDSILSFLMDINIKKFIVDDTNISDFHKLHLSMSDLAASLMKQRHILLMDRIPQFMHIFKDLLQAIVWYKSERQKSVTFTPNELDDLGDLALKLATLMSLTTKHAVHVKRVAPFILTFIINLMVDNKRPTTLHKKIKTHVESICYDLIGICDHRVGRFILRCSNEAGRQLYENLLKDHAKYRKFKGKI